MKFNGTAWNAVGGGFTRFGGNYGTAIYALAAHDDGPGEKLIAGRGWRAIPHGGLNGAAVALG